MWESTETSSLDLSAVGLVGRVHFPLGCWTHFSGTDGAPMPSSTQSVDCECASLMILLSASTCLSEANETRYYSEARLALWLVCRIQLLYIIQKQPPGRCWVWQRRAVGSLPGRQTTRILLLLLVYSMLLMPRLSSS